MIGAVLSVRDQRWDELAAARAALDYPGRLLDRPVLLTAEGPRDVPPAVGPADWDARLHAAGAAPLAERRMVVAVASNGSPRTLLAKLLARDASPVAPLVPAVVTGVAVGHSAHVSLGGYVAAAPFHRPGGAARAVVGMFDAVQIAVLDQSEPNYVRVSLAAPRYRLLALGLPVPPAFDVYRSVWGLLGHHGRVVSLRPQARVHALVRDDPVLARAVPLDDPLAAARLLLHQPVQRWVREHWRVRGQTLPDGLPPGPVGR